MADSMNKSGAMRLCMAIETYWRGRGYNCKTRIEPVKAFTEDGDVKIYQVRSNIGPKGFPPRRTAATKLAA